jgi:membrane-associated HD superfamily phosphohydrolase
LNNTNKLVLLLAFVICVTLILPRQRVLDYQYEIGKKWRGSDLIADYDFPVYKSEKEIEALKTKAKAEILAVYEKNLGIEQEVSKRFEALLVRALKEQQVLYAARLRGDTLSYKGLLSQSRLKGRKLNPLDYPAEEVEKEPSWLIQARLQGEAVLSKLFQKGLLPAHQDTFPQFINLLLEPGMMKVYHSDQFFFLNELPSYLSGAFSQSPEAQLAKSLLEDAIQANLSYNHNLTLREQKRVLSLISPISGYVEKGRTIVARGDVVNEGTQQRIQSYLNEGERMLDHQGWLAQFLSQLLVVLLLTGVLVIYLT